VASNANLPLDIPPTASQMIRLPLEISLLVKMPRQSIQCFSFFADPELSADSDRAVLMYYEFPKPGTPLPLIKFASSAFGYFGYCETNSANFTEAS